MSSALLQVTLWPELLNWLPVAAISYDTDFERRCKIRVEFFQKGLRFIANSKNCGPEDADIATGIQSCIDKINAALADGSPAFWLSRAARRMQIQTWIVEAEGLGSDLTYRLYQREMAERKREEQRQKDRNMYQKRVE